MSGRAAGGCDDRQLVVQFLGGDEASFRRLYEKYTPRLRRVAYRVACSDPETAEEAVQECWMAATQSLEDFRWDSTLLTWLCRIVVRKAMNLRRRSNQWSTRKVCSVPFDFKPCVPEVPVITRLDLERAVGSLANGQRQIFVLYEIRGFTHAEISNMLEISAGTSRSQLHHAKRKLRWYLTA